MPQNICPCPNPPGGNVTCSADHVAFCLVDSGGVLSGLCLPLPLTARHQLSPSGLSAQGATFIVQSLPSRLHRDFGNAAVDEQLAYARQLLKTLRGDAFRFLFLSIRAELVTRLPQ